MFPNLIVAGAGKSGTSSLHLYLAQHPDIDMSSVKEPHFFSHEQRYAVGPSFYDELFPPASSALYRGESSTGYMVFPSVPARIKESIPECRLLFLLRNPIDRALSHYRWLVSLGLESRSFNVAFDSDRGDIPDPFADRNGNYGYIYQEGCYASNLKRFAAHFSSEQILVLSSDDLRRDPASVLNRCFTFLGLTPMSRVDPVRANPTVATRSPKLRAFLEDNYAGKHPSAATARRVARRVLGERASARLRRAGVSALSRSPREVPVDVSREWLAVAYTNEVTGLRQFDPRFGEAWTADFPPEVLPSHSRSER